MPEDDDSSEKSVSAILKISSGDGRVLVWGGRRGERGAATLERAPSSSFRGGVGGTGRCEYGVYQEGRGGRSWVVGRCSGGGRGEVDAAVREPKPPSVFD